MENTDKYLEMDLLRFSTAGSVDDGKSTLIGRLMYDTKSIFEDQLHAIEESSRRKGDEHVNLALLTDGLKAEREQGITIDVAYRYFATPKRKFIIADTPGHIQYTRNMVTGASTANLAIVLVDARKGVIEQTIRHSFIASLLQIRHVVVCINKMDLVDFSEEVFERIKRQYSDFSPKLDVPDIHFIPISALLGDNVVNRSENMPWYEGPTLLWMLENIEISQDSNLIDARLPVQWVVRPQSDAFPDFRSYAGLVIGGVFRVGDAVSVLPSGFTSSIAAIYIGEESVPEAYPPMSVALTLVDDIDVSRGDMIAKPNNAPASVQEIDAMVCWLGNAEVRVGGRYLVKHTTNEAKGIIQELVYKVDINTLEKITGDSSMRMNDIGRIKLRLAKPLFVDSYRKNRSTGAFIIIDEFSNSTVGAGMIV